MSSQDILNEVLAQQNEENQKHTINSSIKDNVVEPGTDHPLQDAFSRFRKERYEKMKHAKYLKQRKQEERRSLEFKEELRIKFIEQCKKYFGVPYHKKYWSEGESHFNAPLFLDCCGLIRQVVYDLREDFGFSLSRWNQAYQFDICPKEVSFEEMRPGDLIFYSATYYNEKFIFVTKQLKPFPHKMVHVEIFTGGESGQQTIGTLKLTKYCSPIFRSKMVKRIRAVS